MKFGSYHIDLSEPKAMAIVNVTPDSFFDGGRYTALFDLYERIDTVVSQGADIVDLGAFSTRPNAMIVELEEEWRRLLPALEYMRKNYEHIPISIDTFRSEIAERVRKNFGEFILNDISAGTLDKDLFSWVSSYKMPYILMHIKGNPQTMQQNPTYENVVKEVYEFLFQKLQSLKNLGTKDIVIDLGFGFGKTIAHNYQLLKNIKKFDRLNCPMLVGVSRKSMIYKLLETTPSESLNGTTVLHTLALKQGAKILRVHDVVEAKQAIQLIKTVKNA